MISTTVSFSVIGSIAIFSFVGTKSDTEFELFLLPLLIIYPACFIIISRLQSIARLAAYLIVFIEPDSGIKFETRLLNFKAGSKLRFSRALLWIFLGLIFY